MAIIGAYSSYTSGRCTGSCKIVSRCPDHVEGLLVGHYDLAYLYGSAPVLDVSHCCYVGMLRNVFTYSKASGTLVNSTVTWNGTLLREIALGRTCGKLTVGHDSVFADYVYINVKVFGFAVKTSTLTTQAQVSCEDARMKQQAHCGEVE